MNRDFFRKTIPAILLIIAIICLCAGCGTELSDKAATSASIPEIPNKLKLNEDEVPVLRVYDTEAEQSKEMDIESYIMGVVAGEMKNDWPIEALKAQAILARTFTMKFVSSKDSSYPNADISTDVREAQAYNADAINDRIREAVNETRGIVMAVNGEFPYAWFHAHSGGITELPSKALEYKEDPEYLSIVESNESSDAPESTKAWSAEFSKDEIEAACKSVGVETGTIESFKIGERGESGRAASFLINEKEVSAPGFRLQIGANRLKSTLIDSIEVKQDSVILRGRGFGHGVGMSQWGAYQMAKDGKKAEEIVHHYFSGTDLVELW